MNQSPKKSKLYSAYAAAEELRYAAFKVLLEQAFKSISLEAGCSMQAVVMRYVRGGTTASRVKSW